MESISENTTPSALQRVLAIIVNGGFLVLVFSLGFMWPSLNVYNLSIPVTDFIFLVVFVIWAIALAFRATKIVRSRFYYVALFFLAACLLSTIFSADTERSLVKLAGEMYLVGLSVLALNLVNGERMQRYFLYAWIAGTALYIRR